VIEYHAQSIFLNIVIILTLLRYIESLRRNADTNSLIISSISLIIVIEIIDRRLRKFSMFIFKMKLIYTQSLIIESNQFIMRFMKHFL